MGQGATINGSNGATVSFLLSDARLESLDASMATK